MTFQMFRFVEAGRLNSCHFKYRITGVNNDKSMCVTPKKFGRLYYEGRIVGNLPKWVKMRLGDYREPPKRNKRVKTEGVEEQEPIENTEQIKEITEKSETQSIKSNWVTHKQDFKPKYYQLPNEFVVEPLDN